MVINKELIISSQVIASAFWVITLYVFCLSILKNKNFEIRTNYQRLFLGPSRFLTQLINLLSLNRRREIGISQYVTLVLYLLSFIIICTSLIISNDISFINILLSYLLLVLFEVKNYLFEDRNFNLDLKFFNKFSDVILSLCCFYIIDIVASNNPLFIGLIFLIISRINFTKNLFQKDQILTKIFRSTHLLFLTIVFVKLTNINLVDVIVLDAIIIISFLVPLDILIQRTETFTGEMNRKVFKRKYLVGFLIISLWILQLIK